MAVDLLHLISLNVQGLRDKCKRLRLIQWLLHQKADIILLQETHFSSDLDKYLINEFNDWNLYHSFGTSVCKGVSILINKRLEFNIIDTLHDTDGRYYFMNIETCNNTYSILNIYAPNDKKLRNSFFDNINTLVMENFQGIKVIGGDFNDINSVNDRISSSKKQPKISKSLHNLKNTNNLTDIWRNLHQDKNQFTWRRKNGLEKSRIDFWLIDKNLSPLILTSDIRPVVIHTTDHQAISVKIKKPLTRGPGFWKFNNQHLESDEYCNSVIDIIEKCKRLNLNNVLKWEICKYEIKQMSIIYSKRKSRERHNRLQSLEKQLERLLSENSVNEVKVTEIENEIKVIYNAKSTGAQIRARIQHLEEGEKNTKYFLSLEKSRQNRKTITSLIINGQRVTTSDEILDSEVKFYEKLYSTRDTHNNIEQYLNNIKIDHLLSEEEANTCEGQISLNECSEALHGMKLNKSPGLDGLTVEFYIKFWPHLSTLVHESILFSFQNRELSHSQKQCVFSLLYKKGDPENLENWRPISLLNVDYKILARVLAERLQKILPKIISLDQQGYIKNRFIGYNIRQIQDIIDYTDALDIEGAVLFLDFKKAFDTVEWDFMHCVLRKFGFKGYFIEWVKIMYTNISSSVINNGWQSSFFNISRGIRQGCPLSALLFIIVAEILAITIRNCSDIKGITVNLNDSEHKIKITQLADDTTLFLKNTNEISAAIHIVENFGKFSGLELNKTKTEGLLLGKLRKTTECQINNIKFNVKVKALGTYFGTNKRECNILNWTDKVESCKKIINSWNQRHLTMFGKITVI